MRQRIRFLVVRYFKHPKPHSFSSGSMVFPSSKKVQIKWTRIYILSFTCPNGFSYSCFPIIVLQMDFMSISECNLQAYVVSLLKPEKLPPYWCKSKGKREWIDKAASAEGNDQRRTIEHNIQNVSEEEAS